MSSTAGNPRIRAGETAKWFTSRFGRALRFSARFGRPAEPVGRQEVPVDVEHRGPILPRELGPPPRASNGALPPRISCAYSAQVVDGGQLGSVAVLAASSRGRGHAHHGQRRQDAFTAEVTRDGAWLVVAVADGVSTATAAEYAALVAVDTAVRHIVNRLDNGKPPPQLDWDNIMTAVAHRVECVPPDTATTDFHDQIRRRAPRQRGRPACTLSVVVVPAHVDDGGSRQAHIVTIGDSDVYLMRPAGWSLVSRSGRRDDEAFGSTNATASVPGQSQEYHEVIVDWAESDVLVLTTDGFGSALGGGTSDFARQLLSEWRSPPNSLTFLRDVSFVLSTYDDDRTAVALWRTPRGAERQA